MSISEFFDHLGAPLRNTMWSWGSQRVRDGAVFLRGWQDEVISENGSRFVCILNRELPDNLLSSAGFNERVEHIELIRKGCPSFIVMMRAVDTKTIPRKIAGFNSAELFVGGVLLERDNKIWLSYTKRVPASSLMCPGE